MKKDSLTFDEAYSKLQQIISEIENDEVGLEEMIEKVNEAKRLIEFCKSKLKKVESQINKDLEK